MWPNTSSAPDTWPTPSSLMRTVLPVAAAAMAVEDLACSPASRPLPDLLLLEDEPPEEELPEELLEPALELELPELLPELELEPPERPEPLPPPSLAMARLAPSVMVAAIRQAIAVEAVIVPISAEVLKEAMEFSCVFKRGERVDLAKRGKYSHAIKVYVGTFPTARNLCKNFPRKCYIAFLPRNRDTMEETSSAMPQAALVQALRRVLRPLVRLMLANGITFQYLSEMLKSLYVEVAERDFRIDNKPPTDSRISLMSGVHRKDVSRLRAEHQADTPAAPSVVSLGANLVAVWLGNAAYLDEAGQPLALPRYKSEGGERSFEALVASVNSDIRSKVVLDEWMRLGIARIDDDKRVCLNADAFVPSAGFDEKAFYFGHNLHDHLAAAAHNLQGLQPPFMDRSVHYDALQPASVQALAQQALDLGMKALLAVNKSAMQAEQSDAAAPAEAPQRMTFGVYFYTEAADPGSAKEAST